MKFKNKPSEKAILQDGRTVYLSRSVAVVGTICLFKDKVPYFLIGKRGKGSADFQGLYNLVCGYLDFDEDSSEAFVRETYEETGVNILDVKKSCKKIIHNFTKEVWDVKTEPNENRQNISIHHGLVGVVKELPITNISNEVEQDEVEEVLWVSYDEINNYEFAFNHLERIEKFVKFVDNKLIENVHLGKFPRDKWKKYFINKKWFDE
jgi:8-oxo-dGTP pyrophosphatase MutT (NUDIX family)